MIDLEHATRVVATAYEGSDANKAYFVSTGADGSVHVTCLTVKRSNMFVTGATQSSDMTGDGTLVQASICLKFSLTQPENQQPVYGTSVVFASKGNEPPNLPFFTYM